MSESSEEYNQEPAAEYAPEPETGHGFPMDAFIPLVLLSISIIVLLGWQVSNYSTQKTQLESLLKNQATAVTQSQQAQGAVTKLVSDLAEAAQTDDTAKAIVNAYAKYFRTSPPATPAASP